MQRPILQIRIVKRVNAAKQSAKDYLTIPGGGGRCYRGVAAVGSVAILLILRVQNVDRVGHRAPRSP